VQASESHSWLSSAWRADWTAADWTAEVPQQHQAAPDQHQGAAAVAVPAQHQGAAAVIQQAVAGACTHE